MSNKLQFTTGIDFAGLDRDLGKVADRIESVGKHASAKVGNAAGDLAAGKLDPGKIKDLVAGVGMRLSSGMADGVRRSSSVMLGFGASMQKMLDKLVGAAVKIFQRIDDAMKFKAFDHAMTSAQMKLSNLSSMGLKPLTRWTGEFSKLDIALGGVSDVVKQMAEVIGVLIDGLAGKIAVAFASSIEKLLILVKELAEEFKRVGSAAKAVEPDVSQLFAESAKAKEAAPAVSGDTSIPPRSQVGGYGRRIGFGTDFTAPPVPMVPGRPDPALLKQFGQAIKEMGEHIAVFAEENFPKLTLAAAVAGQAIVKVGAGIGSVFLRATMPIFRLRNALLGLGDVGKASFHKMYESHSFLRIALLDTPIALAQIGLKLISLPFSVFHRGKKGADGMAGGIKAAGKASDGLKMKIRSIGSQLMMALGIFGVVFKLVEFLKNGVKGASDLNETVSRTRVVFGDAFGPVSKQADELASKFGLTHNATLNMAAGFGAMAQGAGMSEAASASLATQMTKMAADLASSVNIPFEEAGEKIRSALAGEERPLREFGANISEDAVKMAAHSTAAQDMATAHVTLGKAVDQSGKALAKAGAHQQNVTRARTAHAPSRGGGTSHASSALSEQTKIMTRATLVTRGLSYAVGDLERTSDSAANQFRRAGGGMSEFASQIGKFFLPAVNVITTGFNNALGATLEFFDRNQATIGSWGGKLMTYVQDVYSILWQFGATVRETFSGASAVVASWFHTSISYLEAWISGVSSVAHNFKLYWNLMRLYAANGMKNINAIIATLPINFGRITAWLGRNWWNLFKDLRSMLGTAFINIIENIKILAAKMDDALGTCLVNMPKAMVENFNIGFMEILRKAAQFAIALPVAMVAGPIALLFDTKIGDIFKKTPHATDDFKPLLEGFVATTEKFPELIQPVWVALGRGAKKFWDQIAANDKARAAVLAKAGAPPVKKPGPLADTKIPDYKLAGASEIGSKEAYSAVARNQVGGLGPVNAAKDNTKAVKANTEAAKDYLKWAKYQAEKMDRFMNQGMPSGTDAFVVK